MKENIEEDMKLLKEMKENCLFKRDYIDVKAERKATAIEHILSDYKRVLKENEDWQKAYQEEKDKQFELLRENQLAKEAIMKIADERDKLKKHNYDLLRKLKNRVKEVRKLEKSVEQIYEDYQDIGKTAFDYQERIELLEKVIDLMAEVIEECRENGVLESDEIDLSQIAGTDKVKQYFENKVRQESDKGTTGR